MAKTSTFDARSYDSFYRSRVGLAPGPVFIALGILSGLYFMITGTVWAVTGEFTRLGGHVVELFGADIQSWQYFEEVTKIAGNPLTRTDGWIVFAMLIGSAVAALFAGDFRVRYPRMKRRWVQALFGGVIAGFGARLAYGCNLAAMFTGIPQYSLHAWIFTLCTAIGTWIGIQIVKQSWWRGPTRPKKVSSTQTTDPESLRKRRIRHTAIAAVVSIATTVLTVYYLMTDRPMLATAVVFGTAFGVLIQRGQICFTAAFRDLWVTGRTKLADALILGLIAASVVTWGVLFFMDVDPLTRPAGWGSMIGGLLFGIGIVFAGACETGMMYRACEGQLVAWVAFAGNIVGATILAYGWDHWGIYDGIVASGIQYNMYVEWGPFVALIATLVALAAWWFAMSGKRNNRAQRLDSSYNAAR